MKPSASYRRRCTACGAAALKVATRCPGCGDALPTRDARGELLVLWGCHGCHTLNTPDHVDCQHCKAPRTHGVATRRWVGAGVAVAAVATIMVLASSRTPTQGAPTPVAAAAAPVPAASTIVPISAAPVIATPTTASPATSPHVIAAVTTPPAPQPTAVTMADQEVRRPTASRDPALPIVEVVSVTWVNVRSAPTPTAAIVGVIKPQTAAQRLGARDGWIQLKSDSLVGWVYAQGLAER